MDDAVEAIVVGRSDLGEADRVVRLLTAEHGRVDVVARGARASRRRFPGALDVGTRLRATWRKGRGELPTLTGADVVAAPRRARDDYDRLVLLAYGCEVLGALAGHGPGSEKSYRLLERWLEVLEGDRAPDDASRIALEAKALTFAGLAPRLDACAACGGALAGTVHFDADAGGAVHPWCGHGRAVEAAHLAALEALRRTPLADTPGRPVPPAARWLLADFVEYQARRELRSRSALSGG